MQSPWIDNINAEEEAGECTTPVEKGVERIEAPNRKENPVSESFEIPSEAEIVELVLIKLRLKGLVYSSVHVQTKLLQGVRGFKVLIAPAAGVFELREVANLYRVAARYVLADVKVSKSEALQVSLRVLIRVVDNKAD